MILQTLPVFPVLSDDISVDDGTATSGFDFSAFLDSSTGQNLAANVLNLAAGTQGKAAIFKTPAGTYSTAATAIDPRLIIAGVLGLALILYFNRKP